MKLNDFIFRYRTGAWICKTGICRVRTFLGQQGKLYTVLSELAENPSTSITNASELIVQQLISACKIPESAAIVEHYPPRGSFGETFDRVEYENGRASVWRSLSRNHLLTILECGKEEFSDYTKNLRIQQEIFDALHGIPKIERYRLTELPEITERRLEIERNKYTMAQIRDFFSANPSEREIAAFLKKTCL